MSDQEYAELMDEREEKEWALVARIAALSPELAQETAEVLGLTYKEEQ